MPQRPQPFYRLAIRWVRRPAGAVTTAALLAVPLCAMLLAGTQTSQRPPSAGSQAEPPGANRLRPRGPADADRTPLPPAAREARQQVAELSRAPTPELVALLTEGDRSQRLVAANALWARGQRAKVEAVVASSSDRVLHAKLEALKNRVASH